MNNFKEKPSIAELFDDSRYELVEKVNYNNLVSFLFQYFRANTGIMKFFYLFLLVCFLVFIYVSFHLFGGGILSFFRFLARTALVIIVSTIVIVPVHELLHGMVFLIFGAKKLEFGANLKQFYFYVTAGNFVLNKTQFTLLALAPFIIFSIVFIIIAVISGPVVSWISLLLLAYHTSCCIGDMAMISYMNIHGKHGKIYSFDDVETKTSYFFRRLDD